MTRTVIIVQARMGSTRLPGKVLKPIAGRPMLSYQLERMRQAKRASSIVVATTTSTSDDLLVDFCGAEGVECARGPEDDVLSRYAQAARQYKADAVVRVTSDCPLLEADLVDQAIHLYERTACDYASNMIEPTWPYGMAVEVFSTPILLEADAESVDPAEREHVTPFIYWRPQRYRLQSLTMRPDLSDHRWTVDTPEDFELVSRILKTLYPRNPRFTMSDVLDLLGQHPDWIEINRHVAQKRVTPTSKES